MGDLSSNWEAELAAGFGLRRFWKTGARAKFCAAGTGAGMTADNSSDSPRCFTSF